MGLVLLGLSHHTASVTVRERVAYSRLEAADVLRRLRSEYDVPQALLLSTCNRTEVYALVADAQIALPRLAESLFYRKGLEPATANGDCLYIHENENAVKHMFRVACGLDSLVLGEHEILGQLKTAYDISREAATTGNILHRLASRAFHIGKRARAETKIGAGVVSVAYAAVELIQKVFQNLEGRGVLLVGAGENGALCAQHLLARHVEPLYVANRTLSRAEELVGKLGAGEIVPLDRLAETMRHVDIVLCTTGAPEAVIRARDVHDVMRAREGRALVLVDIAVPRDIEAEVDGIRNVFRFDMDALNGVVEQSVAIRRKDVPRVEELVDAEVEGFMRWWRSLGAGTVIRDLHRAFDGVRAHEVEKNARRFADQDREQLEVFSRNLAQKLLMTLTTELKEYTTDDPAHMDKLAVLREVFHLNEEAVEAAEEEPHDFT